MGRRPRAAVGAAAERHAIDLATKLGKSLKDTRVRAKLTQAQAAARAGLEQA